MSDVYERERLTAAVAESKNWTDLMRRLGLKKSGGQRRVLQEKVAGHGLDTAHFKQRSPWRKYPNAAIAAAVASSSSLREVVTKLGAPPASGTLSHISRRITAAGIDVSHFPGMNRPQLDLLFTTEELRTATAAAESIRGVARSLGMGDDSQSRSALASLLRRRGIDTSHFRKARLAVPEDTLRNAVQRATSYADVMRALALEVNDTNHRRVRRKVLQLQLDTSHFTRRPWASMQVREPKAIAPTTLILRPQGSPRTNRERLHRALQEIGVAYRCESCGNPGEWLGQPFTLQIDHINGEWLDNRAENLRYLCPNCHALTDTWCRNRRPAKSAAV
ncbi:HNH endonuclease signature motif containing protein [Streptomyces atratus]|uniref:HNH endonuclease signature motif containing protein n=1 Tax=Streptomyces atratus TaxID=1893 RepID=UPI002AC363A9|nr:HNH endonuclease signature motif containing protein [Streptomyces atratus]WPW29122.1 HNH endonuclease signature motif containing protein [Streptomyces atratus]